jgi:hypothetical protein
LLMLDRAHVASVWPTADGFQHPRQVLDRRDGHSGGYVE